MEKQLLINEFNQLVILGRNKENPSSALKDLGMICIAVATGNTEYEYDEEKTYFAFDKDSNKLLQEEAGEIFKKIDIQIKNLVSEKLEEKDIIWIEKIKKLIELYQKNPNEFIREKQRLFPATNGPYYIDT